MFRKWRFTKTRSKRAVHAKKFQPRSHSKATINYRPEPADDDCSTHTYTVSSMSVFCRISAASIFLERNCTAAAAAAQQRRQTRTPKIKKQPKHSKVKGKPNRCPHKDDATIFWAFFSLLSFVRLLVLDTWSKISIEMLRRNATLRPLLCVPWVLCLSGPTPLIFTRHALLAVFYFTYFFFCDGGLWHNDVRSVRLVTLSYESEAVWGWREEWFFGWSYLYISPIAWMYPERKARLSITISRQHTYHFAACGFHHKRIFHVQSTKPIHEPNRSRPHHARARCEALSNRIYIYCL